MIKFFPNHVLALEIECVSRPLLQYRNTLTTPTFFSFLSLKGLSTDNSAHVSERWKSNLIALSRSVVGQTFMVNQLVDMEWKFGVTAGSSDLKVVGQTFLQLKMIVDRGGVKEDVFMELTLPQFYSFLHEMERAKSTLEFFS